MMENNMTYDELLYGNLKLLSVRYTMSTELRDLLSKKMFADSNTKAFCLVIMYLLNCLNKEKYGMKLPWPIHDRASHLKFHNTVWEVSRSINTDYPNADVPKVQKSFFLHPTGSKFVQYLVKISSLVMLENSKFGKTFSAKQPKERDIIERRLSVLRFNLKENDDAFEAYMNETKIKIRDLQSNIQNHTKIINNSNNTLRKIVDKSEFDSPTKECLMRHDENAMKAIKQDIEGRKKRLQVFIERVKNMKTNLHELNDVIHSPQNSVCGKHLVSCLPSSIIEKVNINEQTGITLEDLMKVLCESISHNKLKLLMEDLPNDFPKLVALKDNLEKLLGQCKNLYCEMKSFFDHVEMQRSNPNNSITEQCAEKSFALKEINLEYLNISTPRYLDSSSTPLTHENSWVIGDLFSKEGFSNRQLKQGLVFSPPSAVTSYISEDVNGQQSVVHKVKAIHLMSTSKKRKERKSLKYISPINVKKNKLVYRVLAMNSPEASTVGPKTQIENSVPTLTTNVTDKNIEETVQQVLQNADSFLNLSDTSIMMSDELESINENVSDSIDCDWNNDSLQRIVTLIQSPEPFLPGNGSSTPLRQDEALSPVEAIISNNQKVSKIPRPSLEALKIRFLKVKETALSIPKLED